MSRFNDISIHEWMMSLLLIVIGVHIFVFEDGVANAPVRLILQTAPNEAIGFAFFMVGFFRISVLGVVNVAQSWVLDLRMIGAALGAMIWLIMISSLVQGLVERNSSPPPGLYMLASQFVGDIWLMFRLARIKKHLRRS